MGRQDEVCDSSDKQSGSVWLAVQLSVVATQSLAHMLDE